MGHIFVIAVRCVKQGSGNVPSQARNLATYKSRGWGFQKRRQNIPILVPTVPEKGDFFCGAFGIESLQALPSKREEAVAGR